MMVVIEWLATVITVLCGVVLVLLGVDIAGTIWRDAKGRQADDRDHRPWYK